MPDPKDDPAAAAADDDEIGKSFQGEKGKRKGGNVKGKKRL